MIKGEVGYKLLTPLMRLIFKLYYNPQLINKKVIPKKGPILIVGNHKHVYDQCLTIMATKRVIHYMAKKEYFEGKLAWLFKLVGCISVDRSIKDEVAKNKAISILNKNGAVGLFPEGTRNKTDKLLLPFKFGAVSMAKKTNALIVPFAITGDYKFRSKNLKIRYGEPFYATLSLEVENKRLEKIVEDLLKVDLEIN